MIITVNLAGYFPIKQLKPAFIALLFSVFGVFPSLS